MRTKFIILPIISLFLFASCAGELSAKQFEDDAEIQLAELTKLKFLVERIYKYLKGEISFYDNFSSNTILYFAKIIFEKETARHKYNVVRYNKRLESIENNKQNKYQKAPVFPKYQFNETINFLDEVIKKRRSDEFIDRFVYFRGYCYEEQGDIEKAVEDYLTIINNYSYSNYLPEVLFRTGEYYFSTNQLAMAIDMYNRSLDFPETHFYEKTLYKLGWSYYQTLNFEKAVGYFLRVADLSYTEGTETEEAFSSEKQQVVLQMSKENLLDEALKYTAINFSNYSNARKAIELFGNKSKPYSDKLFVKLGGMFYEQAKFQDFAEIYDNYVSLYDMLPPTFEAQNKLVKIQRMAFTNETAAFKLREKFIEEYSPGGPQYENNKEINKKMLLKTLGPMISDAGRFYHMEGQRTREGKSYQKAINYYKKYIDIFPNSERSPQVNFFLAEVLFELGRYENALPAYEKTAWKYDNAKYKELAAYNIIFTHEKIIKETEGPELKTSSKNSYWTKNMILAIDKFLEAFPFSIKAKTLIIKKGELHFGLKDYDNTIKTLNEVRMTSLDKDNHIKLLGYIADSYFNKKKYLLAEETFKDLYKIASKYNDIERMKRAKKYIPISAFNYANKLKKNNKLLASANQFARVASLFTDGDKAEKSFGESLRLMVLLRKWDRFDDVFSRLKDKFPSSNLLLPSLISVAKAAEENINFTDAGRYFELSSSFSGKSEERIKLQLLAARNYEKANNLGKSIEMYTKSYNDVKTIPKDLEYRFKVAELLEKAENSNDAQDMYKEIVNIHNSSLKNGGTGSKYYFAKAQLKILEKPFNQFFTFALKQPFKESLEKKAELMRKLVADLMKVSKSDVFDLTTQSFYLIGTVLENFRDSILSSSSPAGFSEEEKEEYVLMLEERAFTYEERALKLYKQNVRLGRAKGDLNRYISKSYSRLSYLAPALYKRPEEVFKTKTLLTAPRYSDIAEIYLTENELK